MSYMLYIYVMAACQVKEKSNSLFLDTSVTGVSMISAVLKSRKKVKGPKGRVKGFTRNG